MKSRQDGLRDELLAILAASRELSSDADAPLAEAFVHFLEEERTPRKLDREVNEACHQPHYSLQLAGGIWGAALMFLLMAVILGHPTFGQFVGPAVLILALAGTVSSALLYLARNDWQVPRLSVSVTRR